MKYEKPEIEFVRIAMAQEVITSSFDENDTLINGGLDGDGNSTDIGGVL